MAVCAHRPAEGGALKACNSETRQGCPCSAEVYAELKRERMAAEEEDGPGPLTGVGTPY